MQEVAQSVHDTTNGKLDRLVVTHEHWDHLSGFLQAGAIFDTFEVGEVWLAWTEDPQDELANELRKRKQKRLNGIVAAAKLADRNDTPAARAHHRAAGVAAELPRRPRPGRDQDDGQGARVGEGPAGAGQVPASG